jgi:hypothetical protein
MKFKEKGKGAIMEKFKRKNRDHVGPENISQYYCYT